MRNYNRCIVGIIPKCQNKSENLIGPQHENGQIPSTFSTGYFQVTCKNVLK